MPGFKSFAAFRDSVKSDGKTWTASFRKVVSNATVAGAWCDLSYSPGSPPPNFYATEPLVSAILSGNRGIDNGGAVSPNKKYFKRLVVYSPSTTFQSSSFILCDYLLYYPFIDGDSTETQELTNSVSLPRFTSGSGVQAILVAQGSYVGNAQVSITYTNQDGTPGRVSPLFNTNTATFAATLLTGGTIAGGSGPFIPLQSGDSGIRSVQSITFSSANGGICAIVLVKPICDITLTEVTSVFATPSEQSNFYNEFNGNEIQDGAYLNLLCLPNASVSGGVLQGFLTTVWG
jgi:hypothetical protein